jgi:hypothetical protein
MPHPPTPKPPTLDPRPKASRYFSYFPLLAGFCGGLTEAATAILSLFALYISD